MKKITLLLCILLLGSGFLFADEAADDYDDGYVYKANGTGDQYLKIALMPLIPLNFGNKLNVGGAAELGYYRFLTSNFALGGEVSASFNVTLGNNALTMIPITFGVLYQPTYGKFEFPVNVNAGIGYQTAQNASYFPSFALNAEAGVFYRFSEMWSFGGEGKFLWVPEWFKDSSLNKDGLFAAVLICARYHF